MTYLTGFMLYLTFPATVAVSYFAVRWVIKKLDIPQDDAS